VFYFETDPLRCESQGSCHNRLPRRHSRRGLFAANSAVPKIHGLSQLHASYPPASAPDIDPEDLDILDPWVIDGRYAADLPDLGAIEAQVLLAAAQRIIDQVRHLVR